MSYECKRSTNEIFEPDLPTPRAETMHAHAKRSAGVQLLISTVGTVCMHCFCWWGGGRPPCTRLHCFRRWVGQAYPYVDYLDVKVSKMEAMGLEAKDSGAMSVQPASEVRSGPQNWPHKPRPEQK
jgi:hypothetical protein